MPDPAASLREYIYLDSARVESLAAQLGVADPAAERDDHVGYERLYAFVEAALVSRPGVLRLDGDFDFDRWTPDTFADGQTVIATGVIRLLDFQWLSAAVAGLPAVLKKMSKLEMEALRNSDEGKRMSKSALQQRAQENQHAIAQVEAYKADELGEVIRQLYGDVVRLKIQPSRDRPACVLVGSAYAACFADSSAALSQKYGVEIDAGWTIVGQLNLPAPGSHAGSSPGSPASQGNQPPLPTGNKIEDAFEQIALMMNNAFHLSTAPAFPLVSMTPVAIYRALG